MDMSIQGPADDSEPADFHFGADPGIEVGGTQHGRGAASTCGCVTRTATEACGCNSGDAISGEHDRSLKDVFERVVAEIELDRTSPLVKFDDVDIPNNAAGVTFYDRGNPSFRYSFWCHGQADALEWVAHMSSKVWVTKRHLEIFARGVAEYFPEPKKGATPVRTLSQIKADRARRSVPTAGNPQA